MLPILVVFGCANHIVNARNDLRLHFTSMSFDPATNVTVAVGVVKIAKKNKGHALEDLVDFTSALTRSHDDSLICEDG